MVTRTRLNATFMRTLSVLFMNKYTVDTMRHKHVSHHDGGLCLPRSLGSFMKGRSDETSVCVAFLCTLHGPSYCISFVRNLCHTKALTIETRLLATLYTKPTFFTYASKCPYPVTGSANTGTLKLISDCI